MNDYSLLVTNEQTIIAALLINNDVFDCITDLEPEAFVREEHRILYKTILSFLHNGEPVDLISLSEKLQSTGQLERVGGLKYISSIIRDVNTTKNLENRAESVRKAFKLRRVKDFLQDINDAVEQQEPIDSIIEKTETGIFNLLENRQSNQLEHIRDGVTEAVEWADSDQKGLFTGLRDLDRLTEGFNKSSLVIIAGRPSMGKSALAMQIAEHTAKKESAIIFSLEMSKREVGTRMLNFHTRQVGKSAAIAHLYDLNLHLDDQIGITLSHIRTQCRRAKIKHGLSMIVVDYLQLMVGKGDNRTQEIGSLSRGLKGIAKEFDIPVVVLSQLSRKVEERADKRPLMSDLRDSGEIEQDADMILFVYRDEVYDEESDFKGIAEIICRKNRSGGTGGVFVNWSGEVTRFSDYDGKPILRTVPKQKGFSD